MVIRKPARKKKSVRAKAVSGGCLCGAVRYEVAGELGAMSHCHCSMCRKAHGAAFATFAGARAADFRFTAGERSVRRYRSSKNVERVFCPKCGSSLLFIWLPFKERLWIAAGTLDGDPPVRADAHIYVASKAPWFEITDDLMQFDADRLPI